MNFTLFRIANFIIILINPNINPEQKESILTTLSTFLPSAKIAFCDLAPTNAIMEFINDLIGRGHEVVSFMDHHKDPQRSKNDYGNFSHLKHLLPAIRLLCYETREQYPACASMIAEGEFVERGIQVVFTHDDFDGIASAFLGCGFAYDGMVADAEIMDGLTAGRKMTEFGSMVQYALSVVPYFTIEPHRHHWIKSYFCQRIADWLSGKLDESRKQSFRTEIFDGVECSKENAEEIAAKAKIVASGVVFADALSLIKSGEIVDWDTLNQALLKKFGDQINIFASSGTGHLGDQVFLRVKRGCPIDFRNFKTVKSYVSGKGVVVLSKWQDFINEWNAKR